MAEIILNEQNFKQEVLESNIPVLIDFWADWCGPCRMLSPIIEEIANEYDGKVKVCKVNVDEESNIADAFRVSSIPLVVVMREGKLVDSCVGYRPKEEIEKMLK